MTYIWICRRGCQELRLAAWGEGCSRCGLGAVAPLAPAQGLRDSVGGAGNGGEYWKAGLPALLLEGGGALHALDVEGRAQDDYDWRACGVARFLHLLDLHPHVVDGVGAKHRHRAPAAAPGEACVVHDDVDVLSLAEDAQRLLQLRWLEDGDCIDRVADAGARDGIDFAQRLLGVLRQDRTLEAGVVDLVGGEDAETTATADDGDPGARGRVHEAESDGEVGHLLDAVDAHGIHLAAERVEHRERAGKAGGMRHNGASARSRASSLQHHERLGGGRFTHRLEEHPSILHALDVGADDLGLLVLRQVAQKVAFVDVSGVAVADDLREADAAHGCRVHHLPGVAAALRYEADGAGLGREAGHEGEPELGNVEAHAVGAEDADAGAGQTTDDLSFEIGHLGIAGLAEAGCEEVHAANALGDAVLDQDGHDARRHTGYDVIDRAVDVEDAGVALEPFDLGVLGVYEKDGGKAELHQREQEAHADAGEAGLLSRDAGDGDGAGVEDGIEGWRRFGFRFGGCHRGNINVRVRFWAHCSRAYRERAIGRKTRNFRGNA